MILLNHYNRPIDIENKIMRRKKLADEEIKKEFSNLILNDNITDWYKNKEDKSNFFNYL